MHFVVLVAGTGSRLKPQTNKKPKCLIEIAGKSILERLLEQAEQTGVFKDAILITGYKEIFITDFTSQWNKRKTNLPIKIVHNPRFHETNNAYSLWCAKNLIKDSFVLCDGDLMVDSAIFEKITGNLIESETVSLFAVDSHSKLDEEAMKFNCNEHQFITHLSKELSTLDSKGESIGLCRISTVDVPSIFFHLNKLIKNGFIQEYYERAFQEYIFEGWKPVALEIGDIPWVEIDHPIDLERAEQLFQSNIR